jgi:hypothetical protein
MDRKGKKTNAAAHSSVKVKALYLLCGLWGIACGVVLVRDLTPPPPPPFPTLLPPTV